MKTKTGLSPATLNKNAQRTQNRTLLKLMEALPDPAKASGTIGECEAVRIALTTLDAFGLLFDMGADANEIAWGAAPFPPNASGRMILNSIRERCWAVCETSDKHRDKAHDTGEEHFQIDVFCLYPEMLANLGDFARLHCGRPEPISERRFQKTFGLTMLERARQIIKDNPQAVYVKWELINHPVEVVAALEGK